MEETIVCTCMSWLSYVKIWTIMMILKNGFNHVVGSEKW